MKRNFVVMLVAAILILSGCATERTSVSSGGKYKVGTPYQIGGVWYYPKEDPFYDEAGIASWYGEDFHGKSTANGEAYNMDALTAAHRTLPLPTVVRVTNLENGRSIRLRVNDRGPYARGRIIDVSKKAAHLLGFQSNGTARVRVQYEGRAKIDSPDQGVDFEEGASGASEKVKAAPIASVTSGELAPPEGALAATPATPTSSALPVPPKAESAPPDLEPDGIVTSQQVTGTTQLWIQVGAFTARSNAQRLVANLSAVGSASISQVSHNGKAIHRVRFGPFAQVQDADKMLDQVIAAGHNGSQIIVE